MRPSRSRARFGLQPVVADAYMLAGDIDKAQIMFDRVVAVANDLGLLAEEFDSGRPADRHFQQALTHRADQHRA